MPVILPREAEEPWLDVSVPPGAVVPLLAPYPAGAMRMRPASRRVNAAGQDDPGLLEPESV